MSLTSQVYHLHLNRHTKLHTFATLLFLLHLLFLIPITVLYLLPDVIIQLSSFFLFNFPLSLFSVLFFMHLLFPFPVFSFSSHFFIYFFIPASIFSPFFLVLLSASPVFLFAVLILLFFLILILFIVLLLSSCPCLFRNFPFQSRSSSFISSSLSASINSASNTHLRLCFLLYQYC